MTSQGAAVGSVVLCDALCCLHSLCTELFLPVSSVPSTRTRRITGTSSVSRALSSGASLTGPSSPKAQIPYNGETLHARARAPHAKLTLQQQSSLCRPRQIVGLDGLGSALATQLTSCSCPLPTRCAAYNSLISPLLAITLPMSLLLSFVSSNSSQLRHRLFMTVRSCRLPRLHYQLAGRAQQVGDLLRYCSLDAEAHAEGFFHSATDRRTAVHPRVKGFQQMVKVRRDMIAMDV